MEQWNWNNGAIELEQWNIGTMEQWNRNNRTIDP